MRLLLGAVALAVAAISSAGAQQGPTAAQVHEAERTRFGFGPLRPGATSDPGKPNSSNADEGKVGPVALPPLFASSAPPSPDDWAERREALARLTTGSAASPTRWRPSGWCGARNR